MNAQERLTKEIVRNRDQDRCVRSGVSLHGVDGSHDHRKLRGQGGEWRPSNIILLSGSGTTGEHGWKHANPHDARILGYYVPEHADPAEVPIRLRNPWTGVDEWVLLDDDGGRTPITLTDAVDRMVNLGVWRPGESL